mmetsp:Transcript_18505/g.19272  ORF Transcript_18505/g.19272 Transcript_18505/m.19272 type:complete len:200 (-) Transcript_18505:41-640(-)
MEIKEKSWNWPLKDEKKYLFPDIVGTFGCQRKNDIHTGIDLYCEQGTEVISCEDGIVVNIPWFTGSQAPTNDGIPSSWWNDTIAILVEGESGVIVYGELDPNYPHVQIGDIVKKGDILGIIYLPVLKKYKGRPMVMLHLELMTHGSREPVWWTERDLKPPELCDPTPFLLNACGDNQPTYFNLESYDGKKYLPNLLTLS